MSLNLRERLNDAARSGVGADDRSPALFLCACPRLVCTQVVLLTFADYEATRMDGARGFSAAGHDDPAIERVVARVDYYIVENGTPESRRITAEMDARS